MTDTVADAAVAPPGGPGKKQLKMTHRAAASGFFGSTLEYYDFNVYASAAAIVLPQVFFPAGNAAVALIASLATYAVGYIARPFGAIVLGNLGDRIGRKNVLVVAMLIMGISTFFVGLLPTYAQVGLLSPVLLVVLRLVQGFAVSGEMAGAGAMIVEHAPAERRGFYASFSTMGTQFGSVLGAAAFIPLDAALSPSAFQSWGWRIPFLLSALVVIVAMIIRVKVSETPAFVETAKEGERAKTPILTVFKESGVTIFKVVMMGMANVLGTTAIVFGTAYATQPSYGVGMKASHFLWLPVAANITAMVLIPFIGKLGDRIGRRPMMILGPITGGVASYAYLFAVSGKNLALSFVLAVVVFGMLYSLWNATFASYAQELFPTHTRVSGFAISMNIALLITSFLPSLFTVIAPPGHSNVPLVIGTATLVFAVIASVGALIAPETAHDQLKGTENLSPEEQ